VDVVAAGGGDVLDRGGHHGEEHDRPEEHHLHLHHGQQGVIVCV